MRYRNIRALVTGGLGFIGSSLSIRLVEEGAHVTIVDPGLPGCGANAYNIAPVADRIPVLPYDIGDPGEFLDAIRSSDVIFNLAGEISHIHSMNFPERDLLINAVSQLRFLQACVQYRPGVRIVYAGTRQIYGRPEYLPVDERHPVNPVDFNGVHKYVATMYHLMLSRSCQLDATVLRLTNVYGPRMSLEIPCQGFLSTFLRRLLTGEPLEVYGDGKQLRDPIYVDDAVEAFLLAGCLSRGPSRTFNVGGPAPLRLAEIAAMAAEAAAGAPVTFRPFPEENEAIDIGSYYTDSSRIREELGWRATTPFEEGIARTIAYYRAEIVHYLDPNNPRPNCNLPEHKGVQRRLTLANL
jgi:UDP-glucose 4-epimerase